MRTWHFASFALTLLFAGCAHPPQEGALSDAGARPHPATQASLPTPVPDQAKGATQTHTGRSLVGRWKGELVLPKPSGKTDPQQEMAEAMAKAFFSDLWIEFSEDGSFKMNMMVPIEGRFKQKGNEVHLTPEKMMGMDVDDLAKMGESGGKGAVGKEPLVLVMSKDGKTLQAKGNTDEGKLIFRRA
jgi:hypothetical protein